MDVEFINEVLKQITTKAITDILPNAIKFVSIATERANIKYCQKLLYCIVLKQLMSPRKILYVFPLFCKNSSN